MPKLPKKPTVYALFIGIDKYVEKISLERDLYFPELDGCVADVTQVYNYLKKDTSLNLKAKMLLDDKATKEGIVEHITTHLGKAKNNDVILLYYSGHGTVEYADRKVWTSETDGRLEGIVCHYDHSESGKFILADKEIRYLLNQLWIKTQAHIVTIFDCCHSGDNTRSTMQKLDALSTTDIKERRVDFVFKQRKWSDFIFSKELSPNDFIGKNINSVFPEGYYVQLSASESNEPAIETGGHGVFTMALLETLEHTGGFTSYSDLNSSIRNKLYYAYEQRSKIYTPNDAVALKKVGFLKKPISEGETFANLTYNSSSNVYRINKGVLNGVKAGKTAVSVKIADNTTIIGAVTSVELDSAEVQFDAKGMTALNDKDHKVQLSDLDNRSVVMRLIDKMKNVEFTESIVSALSKKENSPYIQLTTEPKEAEYDIILWREKAFITRVNDWFRPLIAPLSMSDDKCIDTLLEKLKHIARWQFLNDLNNAGEDTLSKSALKVDITTIVKGIERPLNFNNNDSVDIDLQYDETKKYDKWRQYLKIKVTNLSDEDLYVSGVLVSANFSADAQYLQPDGVKMLEKNEIFRFEDKDNKNPDQLMFVCDDTTYWYNWEKEPVSIKIVYSTKQFQNDALNLAGLEGPYYPQKDIKGIERSGKKERDEEVDSGWNVLDFHFNIKNPNFNRVDLADAKTMLEAPRCTDFAEALYISINPENPLDKNSLTFVNVAVNDEQKKGLLMDLGISAANKWCSYRRNTYYEEMCKNFPQRPRLVSEGDSWFQHPLLNDIIDNVGVYLPVRCLAAAGDTISNYVKTGEFSKVIEEVKPFAFLLSGGGNDILGPSMRNFLVKSGENILESNQIDRFFNSHYQQAINDVADFYRTIFDILKLQQPDLKILVHGYDYVMSLPTGSKKQSWIGKYFDEFGIIREGDRKTAVKYMIDGFNDILATIANEYPNQVYYIDLRGLVADDEWSDEIHPNDMGYQKVSLRFIKKITELLESSKTE